MFLDLPGWIMYSRVFIAWITKYIQIRHRTLGGHQTHSENSQQGDLGARELSAPPKMSFMRRWYSVLVHNHPPHLETLIHQTNCTQHLTPKPQRETIFDPHDVPTPAVSVLEEMPLGVEKHGTWQVPQHRRCQKNKQTESRAVTGAQSV